VKTQQNLEADGAAFGWVFGLRCCIYWLLFRARAKGSEPSLCVELAEPEIVHPEMAGFLKESW
jgi:hypothetical protein